MTVLRWLNQNQGFVTSVLTLVYVIATLCIVFVALRANRLSAKQLTQALELERHRSRPYVIFDLEPRLGIVYVVLRNIGATPAHKVRVSVTPLLETVINGEQVQSALTKGDIGFIAPGRRLEDILDAGAVVLQRYPKPLFTGSVSYGDGEGAHYEESFRIDLSLEMDTAAVLIDTQGSDTDRIIRALREIAGRLR